MLDPLSSISAVVEFDLLHVEHTTANSLCGDPCGAETISVRGVRGGGRYVEGGFPYFQIFN